MIIKVLVLAAAFTIVPPLVFAGEFSEHHGRDPAQGSGRAEARERAAVPSGLKPSDYGVDLTQAYFDPTIGNKLGTVIGLPIQWHDVQPGPDGKLFDFGPIWADDGSDNQ